MFCQRSELLSLSVIALAAGQSKRMRSSLPKVMHSLAGQPMVCHVMDTARALEPANLVVVVGNDADLIKEAVGEGVTYVTQAEQLGTGHAVKQVKQSVAGRAETVLVLYGDTPLVRVDTLRQLVAQHNRAGAAVTNLSFLPHDPGGYGRILRDTEINKVVGLVEERKATTEQRAIGEVNSGVLCFRDEWLWPNLAQVEQRPGGEFYLTDLMNLACEQGEPVVAFPAPDPLEGLGVNDRAKLAQAEAEMRRRINERWMLAGVTLVNPDVTYIDIGVEIGMDTIIWPNTFVHGQTRIGQGCTIGPSSVIRDSIIGDGCRVQMSVVEQARMDEGSGIGPFGRLRKGAHLGPGAYMGNFGEVKNSYLGPGAKMGHMSYLGDATVGEDANIGAGTITCNYDGQRKHRTIIGKEAFVGSDSMLVAPVEIGDGAKTGAGSVVTRDVPPGSVAYGVPARVKPALSSSLPAGGTERGKEESEGD
jgi:bifunctional UDP-N-acetylglucosamine pyrophosphorylase/glucosamine-1-phosphate N-acetyltransferase